MPAPRRTAQAAAEQHQPTLDQAMVELPAPAPAEQAGDYLTDIETVGREMVALLAGAPAEDADDLRRIVAILRSVFRRERSRRGSVL